MSKIFPIGWTPDDEKLSWQITPWYRMLNRYEWRFAVKDLLDAYRFWRLYNWLSPYRRRQNKKLRELSQALRAGSWLAAPSNLISGSAMQIEDLSPVMENVTYNDSHIKFGRPPFW